MAGSSGQEKTEKPTSKRRNDARKEGNVFQSKDITTVILLLGVFWMIPVSYTHLSQIDALLKSMQGSGPEEEVQAVEQKTEAEETKYSKYDFYSPRKFTKDKMKILNSVFENYARILTSQVNGIFRVLTDITVLEVQERRYYEFVNSLHENDSITMANAEIQDKIKNSVPLMLHVTPGLVKMCIRDRAHAADSQQAVQPKDYGIAGQAGTQSPVRTNMEELPEAFAKTLADRLPACLLYTSMETGTSFITLMKEWEPIRELSSSKGNTNDSSEAPVFKDVLKNVVGQVYTTQKDVEKKQYLLATGPVSYTHLDVYKRQPGLRSVRPG